MLMKTCTKCKVSKPADMHHFYPIKKKGVVVLHCQCVPCRRETQRLSDAKNPEARYQRGLRRAANEKAAGTIPANARSILFMRQGGRCAYSGAPLDDKAHIDHRVPVTRGGTSHIDNLALCTPAMNILKRTKTDTEFDVWLAVNGPSIGFRKCA
jgi:5-methylcytosine-specific restriction endonuclease McrA